MISLSLRYYIKLSGYCPFMFQLWSRLRSGYGPVFDRHASGFCLVFVRFSPSAQINHEISEYHLEPDVLMQRLLVQILFVFFSSAASNHFEGFENPQKMVQVMPVCQTTKITRPEFQISG